MSKPSHVTHRGPPNLKEDETVTSIERTLQAARKAQPDLWNRTEQIARIIAPEAFAEGWILHPDDHRTLLDSRLKLEQAIAMDKAQAVLRYLGVNTETDWYEILKRINGEKAN